MARETDRRPPRFLPVTRTGGELSRGKPARNWNHFSRAEPSPSLPQLTSDGCSAALAGKPRVRH